MDNLGAGNRAKVATRRAENDLAMIELIRTQNQMPVEVSNGLMQARLATSRLGISERTLRLAVDSLEKNFAGLSQTERGGRSPG